MKESKERSTLVRVEHDFSAWSVGALHSANKAKCKCDAGHSIQFSFIQITARNKARTKNARNGQWLATRIRYPPPLSIFQINFGNTQTIIIIKKEIVERHKSPISSSLWHRHRGWRRPRGKFDFYYLIGRLFVVCDWNLLKLYVKLTETQWPHRLLSILNGMNDLGKFISSHRFCRRRCARHECIRTILRHKQLIIAAVLVVRCAVVIVITNSCFPQNWDRQRVSISRSTPHTYIPTCAIRPLSCYAMRA